MPDSTHQPATDRRRLRSEPFRGSWQETLDQRFTERYGVGLTAIEFQLFELAGNSDLGPVTERFLALVAHTVIVARTLAPPPLEVGLVCRDPIEGWIEFLARQLGGRPEPEGLRRRRHEPPEARHRLETVLAWMLRVARSGETEASRLPSLLRDEPPTAIHGSRLV